MVVMRRGFVVAVFVCMAVGLRAQARPAAQASASVQVNLAAPAGIQVVSPLVLPTVSVVAGASVVSGSSVSSRASAIPNGRSLAGGSPASRNAPAPLSNATLTIHGQAGDAVSMAVPASFKVIRSGGTEALTVKTSTDAEYGIADNGVLLSTPLVDADAMSINVGGALSFASADRLVPGPYEGMLVLVVQYN